MPMREALARPSRRRLLKLLPLVLVVFYLCFHAISGERGMVAWLRADRELKRVTTELSEVKAQRTAYETKIKGLRANSLDLDLLDEQARQQLGYVGKGEIVIPDDAPQHK